MPDKESVQTFCLITPKMPSFTAYGGSPLDIGCCLPVFFPYSISLFVVVSSTEAQ